MNEQGSKKILFNKSTLLSLKAELLKKQEEVNEKKQLPQSRVENFKPPPAAKSSDKSSRKHDKKTFKDSLKQVDAEELEAHRKAKAALEKKAELYNHLSDGAGSSELAGRFLVDFDTKKLSEAPARETSRSPVEQEPEQVDDYGDTENDDDWVDYTDCLGRTRKCHKIDIELYEKRDRELMRSIMKERGETLSGVDDNNSTGRETVTSKTSEKPLLVQKTEDYLQSLRDKWEQKERELLAKDKDVHYQDLLFDEARIHGVGYYAFSTDEDERRKQMEELMKVREETVRAQREAEEKRKKRDELMAARVSAARARRRLRAGLPPEDPEEKQKAFNECLLQFLTEQRNEAEAKTKEEEKKKKEELEKERQKQREAYVREWDLGKEGVKEPKKFREMTQEEYVEQQRSKRIDEFAPLQESSRTVTSNIFDDRGYKLEDTGESSQAKTWADVRPRNPTPPPPVMSDVIDEYKGLYFTSKKNKDTSKYKNFVLEEPTPIVNELEEENRTEEKRKFKKRNIESTGAEIAPPPTYDYYGPTPKHSKIEKPFESDMNEAFAQGSKSLEAKESKRQLSDQYNFIL